jgi:glucose/arabinose dehydrogenase
MPDATVPMDGSMPVPDGAGGPDSPVALDAPLPPPPLDANAGFDAQGVDASITHPCDLPGSIQFTAGGVVVVPGGADGGAVPDLSYLKLPKGFCVHYYGTVGNARQLRFAPGGELFVASPTTATTGGGNGKASIVVLPDDNRDGYADSVLTFMPTLPSTQGLLFAGGYFYYQDSTRIMRVPYAIGDRTPSGSSQQVADITPYQSSIHWPKNIDIADDGTIYVSNGGDQGESCDTTRPFHGGILKLDGTAGGAQVAKGFRNPIAMRCSRGHNLCFAVELAKDYSMNEGGREKVVPIRQGDDWGFPCCATQGVPYLGITPAPDCSGVAAESAGFYIGDTPFGIDFEPGLWPAPYTRNAIVTVHGNFGGWLGARVVTLAMDAVTGLPLPGSDLDGGDNGSMTDFATGWDDGTHLHGRPASLAFSKDGRLFLGNDNDGTIVWIAPLSL